MNETDDFPHKLCYICSAKLQDFQNFVKKCMETQNKFHKSIGKIPPKANEIIKIKENRESERAKKVFPASLEPTEQIPPIKLFKDRNDWYIRNHNLKELSIVLTRLEDEDPEEIKRRIDEQMKASIKPFYSIINVTGFGTIYTCNYCNEVFTQETIYTHKCKMRNNMTMIESLKIEREAACNGNRSKTKKRKKSALGETSNYDESSSDSSEPLNKMLKKIDDAFPCTTVKDVQTHIARMTKNLVKYFVISGKGY